MHTSESRRAVVAFSVLLKLIFGRGGGGKGAGSASPTWTPLPSFCLVPEAPRTPAQIS